MFQTKLSETAEAIGEQLRRFKTVDSITQQLDAPTLSIYSESFISMLDHLDQTLIYLKEHVSKHKFVKNKKNKSMEF